MEYHFTSAIEIIGVNPFVFVPEEILRHIFKQAGKEKGFIPICGSINGKPYKQTLVKYSGFWRLYINTTMLKNSPKHVGEVVDITISFDAVTRDIKTPVEFEKALDEHPEAKKVFDKLSASRKLEIVRYLANLKQEDSLKRNIDKAIAFLLGNGRFVGRSQP